MTNSTLPSKFHSNYILGLSLNHNGYEEAAQSILHPPSHKSPSLNIFDMGMLPCLPQLLISLAVIKKRDGQHYIIASTLTTQIDHSNGYCTKDGAVRW